MTPRRNLERAPALILAGLLALCGCTTSPRTELSWNVRDHKVRTVGSVEYGPRSVVLPPLQRRALPPAQNYAAVPTERPRRTPGWYPKTSAQPVVASTSLIEP